MITPEVHDIKAQMNWSLKVSGQLHAQATFPPVKNLTLFIEKKVRWAPGLGYKLQASIFILALILLLL